MTEAEIRASAIEAVGAPPKPPTLAEHAALAWRDMGAGAASWRMWLLLGMNDIRQRYRRSRLGQFWITLAMATQIVSLGVLYSFLFKMSVAEYLPYLAASFVIWGLISSIVLESCSVFIGAEGFMRQVPLPKSVFVHRMLVRNGVIFLHNLVIIPILFAIYRVPVNLWLLMSLVAIAAIILNGIWLGLLLGTICARFRDMPQIVGSIMQVVFYLTPVMWRPSQLPQRLGWLASLNPFQSFLDIVREPMLGHPPPLLAWEIVGIVTVTGFVIAALFFSRFRARIVYWL